MPKCFVIYYSLYGHVATLSKHVQKGLESKGIDVEVYQVPETLSDSILEKMHAPAKTDDPIITVDKLTEADGFMFGIPTRFGTMPAQWRSFLDATGRLWASGALAGKFCGTFFSTASQHGGQETTAYMTIPYLAHHGINYVSFGFANASLFNNDEVIGGSAYGAGTVTNGDGSRQPSETELAIARNQAENFADVLNQYQRGKDLISSTSGDTKEKATATDDKQQAATTEAADASKGDATATGAAAGTAAGAGVGAAAAGAAAAAAANNNNGAAAGADSDASIRSIKAASTQKNNMGADKETPVITTTNPEGHTERPAETAAKTEDAGVAQSAAAAGTAGAAGGAATAPAVEGPKETAAATGAPKDTSAQPSTGAAEQQPPPSSTEPPQQPKKKKSKLWRLCCGAEGLD